MGEGFFRSRAASEALGVLLLLMGVLTLLSLFSYDPRDPNLFSLTTGAAESPTNWIGGFGASLSSGSLPDARFRRLDPAGRPRVLGRPAVRLEAVREPQLQGGRVRAALSRRSGAPVARLRTPPARGRGCGVGRNRGPGGLRSGARAAGDHGRGAARRHPHPDRGTPRDPGVAGRRFLRPAGPPGRVALAVPPGLGPHPRPPHEGATPPDGRLQAPGEGPERPDFPGGRAVRGRDAPPFLAEVPGPGKFSITKKVVAPGRPAASPAPGPPPRKKPGPPPQQKLPISVQGYTYPPVSLLEKREGAGAVDRQVLAETGRLIAAKCAEFGVEGEIAEYHPGPVVTTYEFRPAAGSRSTR